MLIHCVQCDSDVEARLTDGTEIYPHRHDLRELPFWKCDTCNNFVGCHHKTSNRTHPLGCIASKELKAARSHIHKILDPLWKSGKFNRKEIYAKISEKIGWGYHTAHLKSLEEARQVYRIVLDMK